MTEVALVWDQDICEGDLTVAEFDLTIEHGLRSAVLISLFTDARAGLDELPGGDSDRRGWWGDDLSENDRIGSKLWLLAREKQTAEVAARAEGYAQEALSWMVEDGVAAAVDVTAAWIAPEHLLLEIGITLPDGTTRELQFQTSLGGA